MRFLFTSMVSFVCIALTAQNPVQVFVLAGQSNMQGHGKIYDGATGAIGEVIDSFTPDCGGDATCDFTFNMLDGFGDGWNGWTYDFVQDGEVMATETLLSGEEGTATITLNDGVLCEIVVQSPGAYAAEISWTVTNSDDDVVASMDGQIDSYPSPNTLLDVVETDVDEEWTMLQTDGEWTVLDDVYLHFENGAGTLIKDPVTIGQGAHPHLIGPELAFAHHVGEYYDEPVLIIKTAWGGLSLGEDFRPPSAGGTVGPYYIQMMDIVESVTENLETEFPNFGTADFEIKGFAWFQGWNDAGSDIFLDEYESNLHHLVNDVRTEFGNEDLPFIIASAGQGGYEPHGGWTGDIQEIVAVAQENVGCDDIQYGGTVGFVDSKAFYLDVLESPDDAGFHYNNNALTFLNVGKAIGDEMILAINNMAYCEGFVSVPEEEANFISVYPNPASHQLTVDLDDWNGYNATVRIYDIESKLIFEQQSFSGQVIDVSGFATGMYVLEAITSGQVHRERVVVK